MKHFLSLAFAFLLGITAMQAQENVVNRIPAVKPDRSQVQLSEVEKGFWISAELMGGYSIQVDHKNLGIGEFDVTAGYRFNEFIRIGVGTGVRYYIYDKFPRWHKSKFGMPLFFAARGNMMTDKYRSVVPYWGFEVGTTFPDGIMFRPTLGLRFGTSRRAWTLGISYMGQNLSLYGHDGKEHRYTNFFMLRTGFEF